VLGSRELDHLDDLSLLRGTAEGDRRAFQALVGRHEAALRRFLGSIVRDDAGAAEDALQETLLAVFRQAKRFEGRSAVRSWLFGIAFRQASKVRRRRVGEPAGHEPLDALGVAAGWGAADADGVDPEARRRIDGHLAGCDWCERFGTGFQRALAQLPAALGSAPGKRAQDGRTKVPPG